MISSSFSAVSECHLGLLDKLDEKQNSNLQPRIIWGDTPWKSNSEFAPEKKAIPKGKDHLPTIIFSGANC